VMDREAMGSARSAAMVTPAGSTQLPDASTALMRNVRFVLNKETLSLQAASGVDPFTVNLCYGRSSCCVSPCGDRHRQASEQLHQLIEIQRLDHM